MEKTKIKTIHEETQGDHKKIIGVLYNYSLDSTRYDVLFYIYKDMRFIFFRTIIDLINYSLYGEGSDIQRSYVSEDLFNDIYDKTIEGSFFDQIPWTK
jgi:hypothetical protein